VLASTSLELSRPCVCVCIKWKKEGTLCIYIYVYCIHNDSSITWALHSFSLVLFKIPPPVGVFFLLPRTIFFNLFSLLISS
jgi:hypothetical protein